MKKRMLCWIMTVALVFSCTPMALAADDTPPDGYNDHDFNQLQAFLEQPSATVGQSNGRALNADYVFSDPTTWTGVTWSAGGEKRVTEIAFGGQNLAGALDASDCTALVTLDCGYNALTSLTVSGCSVLQALNCNNNELESLDLSGLTTLTVLRCFENGLVSLNVSGCTALDELYCDDNELESLTVSDCTALELISCTHNELASLDVSGCTALQILCCNNNKLASLNVSGCTALTGLDCFENELTSLTVSDCTALTGFCCFENELSSLDVSELAALKYFECNDNALTSLTVSGLTALEELICGNNPLTALNVSGCTALTALDVSSLTALETFSCNNNALISLDVSDCTALQGLSCTNNELGDLDVSGLAEMTYLYCGYNALTSLDVSDLVKLKYLECHDNTLTELDVSGLTALEFVYCWENELASLTVSGCTALEQISCSDNALTVLDVSGLPALRQLSCSGNALTSLDESTLTSLQILQCGSNPLASLDVSGLTSLTVLDCSDIGLTTLNVSALTNLHYFYCSDNALTTLNVSTLTALDILDCSNNNLTELDVSALIWLAELHCSGNALTELDANLTAVYSSPYIDTVGNPLAQATVNVDGVVISLAATGGGYVGIDGEDNNLVATPQASARFVNWTAADGSQVAATAAIPFTYGTAYNLTANFASTAAPALIPVGLSCAKTDATTYGGANGSVTVTASGGNSGSYEYSINGGASWQASGYFGGLAANTYMAAVRDTANPGNTAAQAVTIGQPAHKGSVAAKKIPSKPVAGTALTIIPPAAPKGYTVVSVTYTSSNPAVAAVDGNGNVTFLAGGKATIITKVVSQMTDKKGKIKTKTTTVKKSVTVQQPVASISLSAADATIARKARLKLTASIAPGTASNKKLKWTTSNKKVATVSSSGVVTGKAGGTAVITCTAKDGSGAAASCVVTVTPIYPTGIKLNKAALTLKLGKTGSLKATVLPKTTDFKTVTWTSSNPVAVTVDLKGKLKALAPGTAVITATTSTGLSASCTVTVP